MSQTIDFKDVATKLAVLLQADETMLEPDLYAVDVAQYSDEARFLLEKDVIFRRTPLLVALGSDVPDYGSFKTMEIAGIPILVVRAKSGGVDAFLNVCRHRGATVVTEATGCARRFVCPFHAWTFDAEGKLIGVPSAAKFGDLDRAQFGLVRLPCEEQNGLVWLIATPGLELDLEKHLRGLRDELASFDFSKAIRHETRQLVSMNWKLAMDTYMENYHAEFLHGQSIGRATENKTTMYTRYGSHQRMLVPRKSMRDVPSMSGDWDPFKFMSLVYLIYPNVVLVISPEAGFLAQILPGADASHSVTQIEHFSMHPLETPEQQQAFKTRVETLTAAIADEDYWIQETVQRNLQSGANSHLVFGRNEGGLHHFHRCLDAAYADGTAA